MAAILDRLQNALGHRYRIDSELGRGGMAVVFLAEDLKHRRRVAIKVLKPELSQSLGPDRFLREIEIAAQLTHPHILPVFDSGATDGVLYYVMPYVEGKSLRAWLQREGQLPLEPALRLTCQVADALEYAHGRGIVHRDIKWDWPRGEREFRRAIDLDPNYPEARALYSHFLLIMKRPAEGMAQIERALELDPFRDVFRALYGVDLNILGRYDDAIAQFTSALRTAPANPVALNGLQVAYYHKQMYDEALAAEQALWRARGDREMAAALEQGRAEAGYRGAMRRAAQTLAARSRATNTAPLPVASLYARAGDHDQALEWLERSYQARDPNLPYIGGARIPCAVTRAFRICCGGCGFQIE